MCGSISVRFPPQRLADSPISLANKIKDRGRVGMEKALDLTNKQKRVLGFISERIKNNMPPTIREIASYMGFSSTGTVRDYLKILEKKGYLRKRASNLSRAIELLKEQVNRIPVISTIPAGGPDLAYEDVLGYIEPNELFRRGSQDDIFALRVKGESMSEAGIIEGDIAVIRRQATAANGDIIAALLDNNEVTLKRLRHRNNKTYLEAANKDYQPIYRNFTIIGKLITLLRKYR